MYGGLKNKYSILIVTKPEVTHSLMLSCYLVLWSFIASGLYYEDELM